MGSIEVRNYSSAQSPRAVVWPVLVGRVPGRADAYVDRPLLRDRLESTEPGGTVVLTGAAAGTVTQVVSGDGGIG